jgi:hypothetical protein
MNPYLQLCENEKGCPLTEAEKSTCLLVFNALGKHLINERGHVDTYGESLLLSSEEMSPLVPQENLASSMNQPEALSQSKTMMVCNSANADCGKCHHAVPHIGSGICDVPAECSMLQRKVHCIEIPPKLNTKV